MIFGFFLHFCCMIMLAVPSNWLRLWRGARGDTQVLRSLFIEDELLHVIPFTSSAIGVIRTLTVLGINRRPARLRFGIARSRMDLSSTHVPRGPPSSLVNNLTIDLLLQVHSRLSSRLASAPHRPSPCCGYVLEPVLRVHVCYPTCLTFNLASVTLFFAGPCCSHTFAMSSSP
jgi:hypothetical protein